MEAEQRQKFRPRPVEALRALRELLADPDDTHQVFVMARALEGPILLRNYERFRNTELGREVLEQERDLLDTLVDEAYLESLPVGSLGRAYLDFRREAGITAEGLVEASKTDHPVPERNVERMRNRMRDAHDLIHVLTGYDTDLVGEGAVLAFTFAQTGNPALALIVLAGVLKARGEFSHARRTILYGLVRGRRAAWLPETDWEAMLALPLDEARRRLGIDDPPSYERVDKATFFEGTDGGRRPRRPLLRTTGPNVERNFGARRSHPRRTPLRSHARGIHR